MNQAELYREYARVIDMCEGTTVRTWECIKTLSGICKWVPDFSTYRPTAIDFALAIVESRPVFAGDEIYIRGTLVNAQRGDDFKSASWFQLKPRVNSIRNNTDILPPKWNNETPENAPKRGPWSATSFSSKTSAYVQTSRPHPNDVYRDAFARGEPVWGRAFAYGTWRVLSGSIGWDFTSPDFEYSLTDPNPVDPYAHLRKANEEGRVACDCDGNGFWVVAAHWGLTLPPDRYKIVEPDLVWTKQIMVYPSNCSCVILTEEYTLSSLTGKITSKVVG